MKIVIIDYGAGNLFSVRMAVKRLGMEALVSRDADVIGSADRVIFPGVGQASAAMAQLKATGLDVIIPQLKMPVLGICLGMQLMCTFTEEENTTGLGIFPLTVMKISGECKISHMGWNHIYDLKSDLFAGMNSQEWMYFVHSYAVPLNEYSIATCDYAQPFSAAICKDNFYGCQFHPEKSSEAGERVLNQFLGQQLIRSEESGG